jgi:pyruvate dehydrogenase E1 component alpha subunit
MQRDPVDIARRILVGWGVVDAARAAEIEEEVKAEIAAAFEWGLSQPLCNPEDGLRHVFAEGTVPARQFG